MRVATIVHVLDQLSTVHNGNRLLRLQLWKRILSLFIQKTVQNVTDPLEIRNRKPDLLYCILYEYVRGLPSVKLGS